MSAAGEGRAGRVAQPARRRVADIVVDRLVAHGVQRAFSVPGESFLGLLDALHGRDDFDLVTCRHEGSAALAAVADAKLSGRPGVVLASRGPGAFNAGIGLHVACEEAIPLLMLMGQVDTPMLGRGAVQEIHTGQTFAGTLKWSTCIHHPDRTAEIIDRAIATALSGVCGPVAIELPEDVLTQLATVEDRPPACVGQPVASAAGLVAAQALIAQARRPLLLVGGECRSEDFRRDLVRLSEHWGLPVVATNKQQDQFPNDHPHWGGQVGFFASAAHRALFDAADLILGVGSRLGDLATQGFAFPRRAAPAQTLIHVYRDAAPIGRHFDTRLALVCGAHEFVRAALEHTAAVPAQPDWLGQVQQACRNVHGWDETSIPDQDVMGHTVSALHRQASANAVITTDSGNFASWVHRIFRMRPTHRLLGSACGAMGSGVPSALAAALRFPGRQVLAFCGDGGFLMNGNELMTAVSRRLPMVIVVSNNGSYGTIRTHQQRTFPHRVSGTDLQNPDFSLLAAAFGAVGFQVRNAAEAAPTVEKALAANGPVVIEVMCDPEHSAELSCAAMAGRQPR